LRRPVGTQLSLVDRLTFDPVRLSLTGLLFSQLSIGVLGVLVVSAEYGTGTIRATLAASPQPAMVLAAKAVVFGLVALVVSEVIAFSAFFIGQAILTPTTPHATLSQPGVLRAVIAAALPHGARALRPRVGGDLPPHRRCHLRLRRILLILPLIVQALPTSVIDAVGKFLPANIGVVMTGTRFNDIQSAFSPWVGLAILAGYALAALLIGGWLMVRRDA